MKLKIERFLVMFLVKLRWIYFHIHPGYQKFFIDEGRKEAHFFHAKTNSIHSNLVWVDNPTQP